MRNKIFGAIGTIWGGFIIFSFLTGQVEPAGNQAYQTGQTTALIFGVVMFLLGIYYFFKKPKVKESE